MSHRIGEVHERPATDAGFGIRRDIRGVDRAERRHERQPAGQYIAARRRVAGGAVAGHCQVFTARQQFGVDGRHSDTIVKRRRGWNDAPGDEGDGRYDDEHGDTGWLSYGQMAVRVAVESRPVSAQLRGMGSLLVNRL